MTNYQLFAAWVKNTWRPTLVIFYFLSVFAVSSMVIWQRYSSSIPPMPATAPVPIVSAVQESQNLMPLQEQISKLQSDSVRQHVLIERLEAASAGLVEANKKLDRRLQGQLEYNKRLCEYIMVITVDKKIVPRQCLPEYKWQREEGL